jgi:hypothetical protein
VAGGLLRGVEVGAPLAPEAAVRRDERGAYSKRG